MEEVYERLLRQLEAMTPEQISAEWETLKQYNEMGPYVEEYIGAIMNMTVAAIAVKDKAASESTYSNDKLFLAA